MKAWFTAQPTTTDLLHVALGIEKDRADILTDKVNMVFAVGSEAQKSYSEMIAEASRFCQSPVELALASFTLGRIIEMAKVDRTFSQINLN